MKAKILTFVRGLKNGTPPRFQSYLKSFILLGFLTIGISQTWGADEPQTLLSFSRSGTSDSYTSGYTFSNAAEAKTGYYQDGSGTVRYLQLKQSSALFTTTPSVVTVNAKLGGGSAKDPLGYNVYACFVDKDGNNISGSEVTLTTKISNKDGSNFSVSMSTSLATKAYGLKIYHEKESGYNVRYYSFSLTYTAGPSYTITPQSNNDLWGTVELDGSTITATPKSGYRISTTTPYVVTPTGSATVVQDGNEFTVTPSANCTVQINFEEKGCSDHAGPNVTSGSSTSNSYGPIATYYNYSTRQILYTKTDLDLAAGKKGTIKSIYFEYAHSTAMTKKNSVKIYMANTNLTALSKSDYVPYSDFTEVYSGSLNCAQGWNEISLTTPFAYNGSGSLVVLIDDNSGEWESGPVFKYHTANTTTGAQIYINSDSKNENPSSTDWSDYTETNNRPSTKFCIEEADMTTATVTWYVNSVSKHSQTDYPGTTCTAPTTPTTSDCDGSKVFVGWTTSQNYESENIAPSDLFTDPTTKTIPDGGANYYAVFANESISGKSIVKVVDNSFTGSYNGYCGMTYGLQSAGTSYVQKNSIWSGLTTETIKLNIKHISNGDEDVLTVSLIDNAGNNVVSTDVTTQTISSSKDDASYLTNPISLTATSAVTGYKIKLKTKNGHGTCIGEVSRVVEAAITRTNYATKCCTPWTAPTLTYTASASIGANLSPSWGDGTTYGTLTYSSSDEDVLEVNATSGVVTTKAAGTAHVIASWSSVDDYCDNSTTSNEITVTAAYNITYKDKGGADFSGTHEDGYPQTHTYGTATTLKSASKDYYNFNGWFANENCTGTALQTVAADAYTADFTLYAKWTPIVYNITYTLNGGTNAANNPATYTYETATITLQDPSKTGHSFQGWFKEETFVNQVKTIEQGSHGDIDLFAEWSVKNYTLTWDLNGGSITTPGTTAGDVAYGTVLTAPTVERTGYKFTGWKKGGVSVDFTQTVTMPAENATYVAQWTAEVYDISYQDKGGAAFSGSNLASLPKKHTYNAETQLTDGVKTGYHFDGWFGNSECTGSAMTSVPANTYSQDFTLYAKWTINSYTLTWVLNGGTVTEAGTAAGSVVYATELTAPILEKTGYTYTWSPVVPATMPASNSTYSAIWTANKYEITYLDKGGTEFSGIHGANRPTQHTYGTATPLVSPTKAHYDFAGWYLTFDCSGEPLTNLAADGYLDNITLYAKWNEHAKYTVTFIDDVQGTDCSAWNLNNEYINTQIVFHSISDKTRKVPDGDCVTDHYHFVGWVEDGVDPQTNPVISAGTTSIKITKNVTYKAVWAKEL